MSGIVVELNWSELADCLDVGLRRWVVVRALHLRQNGGTVAPTTKADYVNHCLGAMGEFVVAKHLDAFWPGFNAEHGMGAPDLGGRTEVRVTSKPDGNLVIRPQNDPAWNYVLVDGSEWPRMLIVGWFPGALAREPQWHYSGNERYGECWFVPRQSLHPIDTIERPL